MTIKEAIKIVTIEKAVAELDISNNEANQNTRNFAEAAGVLIETIERSGLKMDDEKLERTADRVTGMLVSITGRTNNPDAEKAVKDALSKIDMTDVLVKTCPDYDEWLLTLSTDPLSGLADECWSWIRSWGNGGGDCSTENLITDAINEHKSDVPKELADVLYRSIADHCKTPFEASALVMMLLSESINECQAQWVLSDDSCCQYIRKNSETLFSLIELKLCIPMCAGKYEVYEDTIDVQVFFDGMKDELDKILRKFGYKNRDDVKSRHMDIANMIIAKCIFEHYGSNRANQLIIGTREEAEKTIKEFIKTEVI